ncbi:MAG: hypothetical protein QF416_11640 [Candidatus Marinimicrobia bacterium]|jgi:hypothetical protein|nr:hypothetical protein [Candidatus Neomarinimicrobiota bacterium]
MKLGNQALGAIMMALQKSLMEQSDIVPVLLDMNFQVDPEDGSQSQLVVTNPPTFQLDEELAAALTPSE